MLVKVIAAFIGTMMFASIFNIALNELIFCGLTGGLGWCVYLMVYHWTENAVLSSFFATMFISILAQILARLRKNPITIYQIPGIFALVPGAEMYRIIYHVVNNQFSEATKSFYITAEIAGSIAIGMVLVSSGYKMLFFERFKYKGSED